MTNELKVVSICHYLTGDLKRRNDDWAGYKMVRALKGHEINGFFDITVDNIGRRFNQANIQDFVALAPKAMAEAIGHFLQGSATIVPIPNSHVTDPDEDFKTKRLAEGIAAALPSRLEAVPALVFRQAQTTKSSEGGPRRATYFEGQYRIAKKVVGPVVLIDDVCTLGGHLVAATWKLNEVGADVRFACTFGHTVHEYPEKSVAVHEHSFSLARPIDMFDVIDF